MQEGFRLSVSLSAAISSWVPQVVPSEAREEMDDTAGKMVKGKASVLAMWEERDGVRMGVKKIWEGRI